MTTTNDFGQIIGDDLPGWSPRPLPSADSLPGRFCRLEKLAERHIPRLLDAFESTIVDGVPQPTWTYLSAGPTTRAELEEHFTSKIDAGTDTHYAIVEATPAAAVLGTVGLINAAPAGGSIEMGWVTYSPQLARTATATEAQYLAMAYVFEGLGYRRYEWKCDCLNEKSRAAALRLGFTYEGRFRQATVYKGRTRDTDWFSIMDTEWPPLKESFEGWLDPSNFDDGGTQVHSLAHFRA